VKFFVYYNKNIKKAVERFKKLSIKKVETIKESDCILVIGGDGSLLKIVPEALKYNKDIIYYKSGEKSALPGFKKLDKNILNRIDYFKRRSFSVLKATKGNKRLYALNDIVLKTGKIARLFEYSLEIDKKVINYKGDGILFSTALGSTAYNLALSGPIVDDMLKVIIVNPIASFDSNKEVFVLSEHKRIKCMIKECNSDIYLWADGQRYLTLKRRESFYINLDKNINLIVPK